MKHIIKIHRKPRRQPAKHDDKRRLYRAGRAAKAYTLPGQEKGGKA